MINIKRWYHSDCTIGRLSIAGFQCFTLELPDLNNESNRSCIQEGVYNYETYNSPKHGEVLLLLEVENRTYIEVHAGNFTRQIRGCILVGDSVKWIDSDSIPDVSNSKNTLKKLLKLAGDSGQIRVEQ